jgi:hypothetical protein
VPVLLTNSDHTLEVGGSWSPDGSRFVYVAYEGGKTSLMMVKTSGGATPLKLIDKGKRYDLPDWSSTGDWITYNDDKGWNLISPDGKSFVYTTAKYRNDLWMLQGYCQPGLWNQIKRALPGHFFQ